jgi:hypothetical protein
MNTILTIGLFCIGFIITLIGYFLKTTHSSIIADVAVLQANNQSHIEEQGRLKGKIELLEQEHRLKYQLITETTQQEIKNMAAKIGELSDTVGKLITIQLKSIK